MCSPDGVNISWYRYQIKKAESGTEKTGEVIAADERTEQELQKEQDAVRKAEEEPEIVLDELILSDNNRLVILDYGRRNRYVQCGRGGAGIFRAAAETIRQKQNRSQSDWFAEVHSKSRLSCEHCPGDMRRPVFGQKISFSGSRKMTSPF